MQKNQAQMTGMIPICTDFIRVNPLYLWAIMIINVFVSCSSPEKPLFKLLDAKETHIEFVNQLTETEQLNINQYLYAYNGGGVAVGDINNDGKPDVYFSANQLSNKLYLNKTIDKQSIVFDDITTKAGVVGLKGEDYWTTGVVMVDINGDGWLDIYVNQVSGYRNFKGRNQLFINNKDLTFSEKAKDFGLDFEGFCQQSAFFDYDNDGDLDLYQLKHSVHSPEVYQKADSRAKRDRLAGDKLLKNENGVFVDVSEESGIWGGITGYGLAVGISDLDNNGFQDIYVSNDFHENDFIYFNNGNDHGSAPRFSEKSKEVTQHNSNFSMGNDIADINNDGLFDILTLDMKPNDDIIRKQSADADPYDIFQYKLSYGYHVQYPRNMLHLNQGKLADDSNCQFSEIGQYAGIDATDWSWSSLLADFDNDGFKDIFISNGILRRPNDLDYINYTYNDSVSLKSTLKSIKIMPNGAVHNFAYQNQGNKDGAFLPFKDVSAKWGFVQKGYSMGTAYADFDNDGDLDLAINNLNAKASIYENQSNELSHNNYLKIRLNGNAKNAFGVGAKVEIETVKGKQVQELNPVRGWLSSMGYDVTFGVGSTDQINKISIKWADGSSQTKTDIGVNQLIILNQSEAVFAKIETVKTPNVLWHDITKEANIDFIHQENNHSDFSNERLMPQLLSTQGPKLGVADVNGDGFDDFYVGGATNQAGALYIQVKRGENYYFEKSNQEIFNRDKAFEDVGIRFFDADADKDLDLVVVSGDGQTNNGVSTQDRLYLNDGKGNFSASPNALPLLFGNKSCVITADFNHDHRPDIFIGTRSIVQQYGVSPDSYVLINKGNGIFTKDDGGKYTAFKELGMISTAKWIPQTAELVVAGDWMPITILKLQANGIFTKRTIKDTEGWWNTVQISDFDNDGDMDILAGNRGLNADIRASINEPVTLMVKDFDLNLTFEPIICHFRKGEERLFEGLNELKKQMPMIQTRFRSNQFFAVSRVKDIFPDGIKKGALFKKAVTFESIKLTNKGNGEYDKTSLPLDIQIAPITAFCVQDFNKDGMMDVLSGGNFSGFKPSIGQMTSGFGGYLESNKKGEFKSIKPQISGLYLKNEVRDMQSIRFGNQNCVLIANNNRPVQLITYSK